MKAGIASRAHMPFNVGGREWALGFILARAVLDATTASPFVKALMNFAAVGLLFGFLDYLGTLSVISKLLGVMLGGNSATTSALVISVVI